MADPTHPPPTQPDDVLAMLKARVATLDERWRNVSQPAQVALDIADLRDAVAEIERLRARLDGLTPTIRRSVTCQPMTFSADPDVLSVVEFMQRSIPAARLVGVAAGVHALAPLLWGRYPAEAVIPVGLSAHAVRTQPATTESLPTQPGDPFRRRVTT